MTILEDIRGPRDLMAPNGAQPGEPADDTGKFLVKAVAGTGGRLGPGSRTAELSAAPHRASGPPAGRPRNEESGQ
ncbi:hypothetical protein ACFVWY_16470 [Streptomyces sp. NPDC058195]|uniref:hypothetical protein n=1 Tax=Streptomyces sp. NPDC058195 TaxID=3346375 RepID=UPI0036E04450